MESEKKERDFETIQFFEEEGGGAYDFGTCIHVDPCRYVKCTLVFIVSS
jgi:hypothetical protein